MRGRRTLSFLARCELCVTQTELRGHVSYVTISIPFAFLSALPRAKSTLACGVRPVAQTSDTPTLSKGELCTILFYHNPPLFVNSLSSLYIPIKIAGIVHIAENAFRIKETPSPSSHPPQVTQPSHIRGNSSQDLNNFHIFHILFTFFACQKQIDPRVRVRPIQLCAIFWGERFSRLKFLGRNFVEHFFNLVVISSPETAPNGPFCFSQSDKVGTALAGRHSFRRAYPVTKKSEQTHLAMRLPRHGDYTL